MSKDKKWREYYVDYEGCDIALPHVTRKFEGVHVIEKAAHTELLEQSEKLLDRIAGMCGHPDSTEGCRNILQVIKEYREGE